MVQSKTCSGENVSTVPGIKHLGEKKTAVCTTEYSTKNCVVTKETYNIQSFVISKDLKMNHKTHRHFHKILVH